jgi:subtilisin family serine protease
MDGSSEAFAGLSGRGVRIAVIDSGINLSHPHISAPTRALAVPGISEDAVDQLGHGTAVTAAIQEKAPDAEYLAIKLFSASLRTTTALLIRAFEYALEQDVSIINLSLGTPNFNYRPEFERLVRSAERAGTVVVSARADTENPVLPGCLPGVISVDVDWDLARDKYQVIIDPLGQRYFAASGFPRSLPGVPPKRNLHGISFAVANMTGFAALACERTASRTFADIADELSSECLRVRSASETRKG